MDGYDHTTYGDSFADVYDEWYAGVSDVDTTVALLLELSGATAVDRPVRVLELGVGTGRLAIPLSILGGTSLEVVGVDASAAMLARLRERDPDGRVTIIEADMVTGLPDGPFDLAFVAYNTLFNLTGETDQGACMHAVEHRLVPGGRFLVEAFVPDDPPRDGDDVSVRSMTANRVVLSISRQYASDGRAEGHFVELTESRGVRLRPWSIRYRTPQELDDLAARAGLTLEARWQDATRALFTVDSDRHLSVYRKAASSAVLQDDQSIV